MLSAQRLNEVGGMRWDEIEGDVWAIPGERHKSKNRHEVPLSSALVHLLATAPRHDDHVFSVRSGRPVKPGQRFKIKIDRETGVSDWRFHDLRRSGATMMAEGGVQRFILERVLGHSDRSVTAVYDRATYREEKRQALEVLAATVGKTTT
jgi:integrase